MSRLARLAALLLFAAAGTLSAQDGADARAEEFRDKLRAPNWVVGPRELTMSGNATRLEWATLLRAQGGEATNFLTKILGRKGYTTVVLVTRPDNTAAAVADVDSVLRAYRFNGGDTYADWRPGDKVAEYGLTGLIVGGAVAAAVKTGLLKGLWKFIVAGIAAFWKLLLPGTAAVAAALRSLFKRRQAER